MATLNFSLPDAAKRWVEARVRSGGYRDEAELMLDLIRREQERDDRIAAMQRLVDDGRNSGISGETMASIRARALDQMGHGSPE
ncbi:MAG: ribbon-helix-helix domain-containing protein [Sphingomonas sp.]